MRGNARTPCALLVGGDATTASKVRSAASRCGIDLVVMPPDESARSALVARKFDVVLLADEADTARSLAPVVARLAPATKTMVLSRRVSVGAVIEAMRSGAIDYVTLPFEDAEFGRRLLVAVERSRGEQEREDRAARLRRLSRQLEESDDATDDAAPESPTEPTDGPPAVAGEPDELALSVPASTPMDEREIDMAAEYRSLLRQELDLEDLLRVGVEYLIGKTGATNAAVYLPSGEGVWSLGAYVNYNCPRATAQPMLVRLAEDLCPELARQDDLMRFEDTTEFIESLGLEKTQLGHCDMVAWPCNARRNGDPSAEQDCLAVFVLFRDKLKGFPDELAGIIDTLRVVFAEQVAMVLRIHHRATGGWPSESGDDEDDQAWGEREAA